MAILGIKKFKKHLKMEDGYYTTSNYTTSDAVVMQDGNGEYSDDTNTLQKNYNELIQKMNDSDFVLANTIADTNGKFGGFDIIDLGSYKVYFTNGQNLMIARNLDKRYGQIEFKSTDKISIETNIKKFLKTYRQLGGILVNGWDTTYSFAVGVSDAEIENIVATFTCVNDSTFTGEVELNIILFMRN